ncbi:PglZ domain-containing protein [Thiorhodovibrio frisius]|uniref:PglZ domain-containing protein n=1 Tax=Thiorhodovibrio frisius TaxID=631362 RepID=H8Z2L3_9GAMM|nr:PglZ domain-containing protein [Thiorhodovibrio frisius]EIC22706.1 PglZ domain-containing protein [Thiorhodovibrio frisius]WPL22463.1 PglZ domain protein [Thiorhodovibrio frisius]
MSITEFISQEVLLPRLAKHQVLAVYDPERRYRDLCLALASEQREVVDASESSIDSRLAALNALGRLGNQEIHELLVYVPTPKPLNEEDQQHDPFALYAACGAVFPEGDGDDYQALCLKAKPDDATQVRAVFAENANPSFAVIDAIGAGGLGWPNLRALLNRESSRDILFDLLAPSPKQQTRLKDNEAWVKEARDLLKSSFGLRLKTKGKTWSSIADEFWRFLLFSEFAFDLPESLPAALEGVPRASDASRLLVEDLCDRLRSDLRTQARYIEQAERVEQELDLAQLCAQLCAQPTDLGTRDTFAFEERAFLRQAMAALLADDSDQARAILAQHRGSVWTGKGESQAQWDLLQATATLVDTCADLDRVLGDHSAGLETLVDFYVRQLREMDRLHREFEQAVSGYAWQDAEGLMQPVIDQGRQVYGQLASLVQQRFTQHLQHTGWPLTGRLSNTEVFDTLVAPPLQQSGQRVAYLLIDALRYELGVALERQLAEDGQVELRAAMAPLPSITPVGMASLLPAAQAGLRLVKTDGEITPTLHDQAVTTVTQRMDVIRKRYGQRFQQGRLDDFVLKKLKLDPDADLLVLRSVEIDSQFENHPDSAPGELTNALKRIRVAVTMLKAQGFREVIIATDHGFFMNTHAGPGDSCTKPVGDWLCVHDRCLLGQGAEDRHHFNLPTEKLGVRGDFARLAGPLSLAAYRSGLTYFHGGASLQELVVPVIRLQLTAADQPKLQQAKVALSYKQGMSRHITTRVPVFEVAVESQDLFSEDGEFEILLEAQDKKGNVVGEAKPGGLVDPASGTITLKPGDQVKITLKMSMEYEGKFKVLALNPNTMGLFAQLDLETDYTV